MALCSAGGVHDGVIMHPSRVSGWRLSGCRPQVLPSIPRCTGSPTTKTVPGAANARRAHSGTPRPEAAGVSPAEAVVFVGTRPLGPGLEDPCVGAPQPAAQRDHGSGPRRHASRRPACDAAPTWPRGSVPPARALCSQPRSPRGSRFLTPTMGDVLLKGRQLRSWTQVPSALCLYVAFTVTGVAARMRFIARPDWRI